MRNFRLIFCALFIWVLTFVTTAFAAPPGAAAQPTTFLSGLTPGLAIVAGMAVCALVLAIRHWQATLRVAGAANRFCKDYFLLMLVLGFIASAFAAPNVSKLLTSLVIRPDIGADSSATNGVLRLYSANKSNYMMIGTNGELIFFTVSGNYTGWNGAFMATNAGGISQSNTVFNGVIVKTNGTAPVAPR